MIRGIERGRKKLSPRLCNRLIIFCKAQGIERDWYRKFEISTYTKVVEGADPDFSKDARRILKLSQRQFASELEVSRSLIYSIESGRRRLSDDFIDRVDSLMQDEFPHNPQFSKARAIQL